MTDGGDARHSMHGETHVPLAGSGRLARVDAHAHPELDTLRPRVRSQPALAGDRRCDRVLCPPEGDEERIALAVDLVPAVLLERLAQDALVLSEGIRIALAQLLEQSR